MKKLILFMLSLAITMSAYSQALDTYVARVTHVKGEAFKINEDSKNKTPLLKGDKVYVKDRLRTFEKSIIKLSLVDESVMTLGPKSEFYVKAFNFKSKKDRSGFFEMVRGKLRANIPIKTKKDSIQVHTKTAAMAVRGTKFIVNAHEDEQGDYTSEFVLLQGRINVFDKIKRKDTIMEPGEHFIMSSNSKTKLSDHLLNQVEKNRLEELILFSDSESMEEGQFIEYGRLDLSNLLNKSSTNTQDAYTPESKESGSWKKTLKQLNKKLKKYSKENEEED